MKRWRPILLVFVAVISVAAGWKAFLSPGTVVAPHAEVGGNCDACHMAFDGIPDERCLACHEDIGERIASGQGFHAGESEKLCIACHTDHHGAEGRSTKEAALTEFHHDKTNFALVGSHADLDCAGCHTEPLAELEAQCTKCHSEDDPHESALGPECEVCHSASGWPVGLKTLSDHGVAMEGGHDGLVCADCHTQGDHLADTTSCHDCHDEGHGGTDASCGDCHEVKGWKPAKFDHGPCTCAFPGKHQTVGCIDCHEDFGFVDTPTRCEGCHQPEGAHEPLGGCAMCHTATSWDDGRFDHNKQADFHLGGEHLSVSCVQCHTEPGVFRGAPTECESCHRTDAHPDFGPCAECHTTEGFSTSSFEHPSTGFSLDGKHATLECAACHAPK
jgi:hypothetical protein